MPDPLAVRQIQLEECLCVLESKYRIALGVNAQVSAARRRRLRSLRARLARAQAGFSRKRAQEVTALVTAAVAREYLLWVIETSFFNTVAHWTRLAIYAGFVFCGRLWASGRSASRTRRSRPICAFWQLLPNARIFSAEVP